jgi:NitT/TauT family transport system substrate-binding protein
MSNPMERIVLMANTGAFGLPWFVAAEEGFFAEEGLQVELLERDPYAPERPLFDRRKERSLTTGASDMYTVCAWAPFTPRFAAGTNTKIVYAATMESPYAIVVRDHPAIRAAVDLAEVPIAVKLEAGSHYATIDLLENVLFHEQIRPLHVGGPLRRLEHVLDGRCAAATLMEHYIDVALANGCRVVAEARYPEIIAGRGDLTAETLGRFSRAVDRAIDRITADPTCYLELVYADLPPTLARPKMPPRFAYVRPRVYDRGTFERTASWMRSRGFIAEEPRYDDLVLPATSSAGSYDASSG